MQGLYLYALIIVVILSMLFTFFVEMDNKIFFGLVKLDEHYKETIRNESWEVVSKNEIEQYLNEWEGHFFEEYMDKKYVNVNLIESRIQTVLSELETTYDDGKKEFISEDLIDVSITETGLSPGMLPRNGEIVLERWNVQYKLNGNSSNVWIENIEIERR